MEVTTSATAIVVGATPEQVFAYATTPSAAAEFFTGYGPIPAIRSIEFLPSSGPHIGGERTVRLVDGSELLEEIVGWDPPRRHSYRVTNFRPPLSRLASEATGSWTFEPTGQGTRITWHYAYRLTTPLAWPLAVPLVKLLMRGAMQRALDRIASRSWS